MCKYVVETNMDFCKKNSINKGTKIKIKNKNKRKKFLKKKGL